MIRISCEMHVTLKNKFRTMKYNKQPYIEVEPNKTDLLVGWQEIAKEINTRKNTVIVLECYQGVYVEQLIEWAKQSIKHDTLILASDYMKSEQEVRALTQPDVTNDRIFGYLTRLNVCDYFGEDNIDRAKKDIASKTGVTLIVGIGASLLCELPTTLVYADMARWEIQLRMRKNEVDNIGISNRNEPMESKYKRGFFVDWRACDRLKKQLMNKWDFVLDTNKHNHPKMVTASLMKKAFEEAAKQPFSVVPYFDAGPWGGQWMKEVCDLDRDKENYAWCFNCVPEENSLLFKFAEEIFEIPSVNLVFAKPQALLGEAVHGRFGTEFPIRFDFLDTMEGGNLSLQVHPLTEYIQEKFGMPYTQDESYYMLDAKPGAKVYLGLKNGVNPKQVIKELEEAQETGIFDAEKHVGVWDAQKHDHFLIPGGTIHCSGSNSMVLEISSTPYIFTFKLWDWGRLGMDGYPRPINVEHGKNVIQWDRDETWTKKNLINCIVPIAEGDGWREEKTGLHEREFIETRRFWFSKKTKHNTKGGVHVLSIVEGEQALVESPTNAFAPFLVNYAEAFIVPAGVGEYTVCPCGSSEGKEIGLIKAYVRTEA